MVFQVNFQVDFLKHRNEKVVLNDDFFSWDDVNAGTPPESILGPLLFSMNFNYLTDDLSSSAKLFANDTSLFSAVFNVDPSAKKLNGNPAKVQDWALQWKVSFNPDISKQTQGVIFKRKLLKTLCLLLMFHSNQVNKTFSQKHLDIILDETSFGKHLSIVSVKINKTLYVLCKLQNLLPRPALITLYILFIRPYLDYRDNHL